MDLDDYFISKREEYIMDSFKFQSGDVLNNVSVEYLCRVIQTKRMANR